MTLRQIPLPQGLEGSSQFPRQKEQLYNLFFSNGATSRPGVDRFTTGNGACRGLFVYQNQVHIVSGNDLLRISNTGTPTNLGTITGTAVVRTAVDFAAAALVDVSSGLGWELIGSTLTPITDPDYELSRDVTVIGGRFVYVPISGGPPFYSMIGQPGNIDPLNFFDAEVSPDANLGVTVHVNDLLVLGATTIERFRLTGPDDAPFVRVEGGKLPFGYLGGKVDYNQGGETVAFIGRDEDSGRGIFTLSGRISNPFVSEFLDTYSDFDLLDGSTSGRITWHGNDIILFFLPNHTLAYNGKWSWWGSGQSQGPWIVNHVIPGYSEQIVGTTSNIIGTLSQGDLDITEKFDRYIQTFVRTDRDAWFNLSSMELDIAFTNGAGGSVGLSTSQDGILYGPEFFRATPGTGNYRDRVQFNYPGGLGSYESFAGIRLRTTESINYDVDSLWADID